MFFRPSRARYLLLVGTSPKAYDLNFRHLIGLARHGYSYLKTLERD